MELKHYNVVKKKNSLEKDVTNLGLSASQKPQNISTL